MIPLVPDDASLPSIVAACLALGGDYHPPVFGSSSLLGFGAQETLRRCLGRAGHRTEAERHTLAPLQLALRNPVGRERFREDLERKSAKSIGANGILQAMRLSDGTRRCPVCVREDLLKYGFAYARAAHQLAPVIHCWKHDVALEAACASCGVAYPYLGVHRREGLPLPLHICGNCGAKRGEALPRNTSRGYVAFARLIEEALAGGAPILAPRPRFHVIEHARLLAQAQRREFSQEFVAWWDCETVAEVAKVCCMPATRLQHVLAGKTLASSPYVAVALTAFAVQFLLEEGIEYLGEFSVLREQDHPDDVFAVKLAAHERAVEAPNRLSQLFAEGASMSTMLAKGHPRETLQQFIDLLPQGDREEIERRRSRRAAGQPVFEEEERQRCMRNRRDILAFAERYRVQAGGALPRSGLRVALAREHPDLYHWGTTRDLKWFEASIPTDRDAFSLRLNALARALRIPKPLRQLVARGASPGELKEHGFTAQQVARFLDAISPADREEIETRRLKTQQDVDARAIALSLVRDRQRNLVTQTLEGFNNSSAAGRLSAQRHIKVHEPTLHRWMERYDREWYDKAVPRAKCWRRRRDLEPSVDEVRKAILASGLTTRKDLRAKHTSLYRWSRTNDADWFDATFPDARTKRKQG